MVRTVSSGPRAPGLEVETFSLGTGRPLKELERGKTRLEFWKTSHGSVVEAALGRGWGESWARGGRRTPRVYRASQSSSTDGGQEALRDAQQLEWNEFAEHLG